MKLPIELWAVNYLKNKKFFMKENLVTFTTVTEGAAVAMGLFQKSLLIFRINVFQKTLRVKCKVWCLKSIETQKVETTPSAVVKNYQK